MNTLHKGDNDNDDDNNNNNNLFSYPGILEDLIQEREN